MKIKKVLITGAGGFIGSHLAEKCVANDLEVTAFIKYNSSNNQGWLENSKFKKEIKIISGDIRDYYSIVKAIKGQDTIFHLAALIGIPYSYVAPLEYIKTNIEGTYNILAASLDSGINNIIITSTSETYGTAQYVPIDEKHPTNSQSPYAASKAGADQLALSFNKSFGLPIKIARPFNVYGPRQSARAIIPTIISQIVNGSNEIRVGNLKPTRDLTFVKDTVEGFMAIACSNTLFGQTVNIGMNNEISVKNIVKLIMKLTNKNLPIKQEKIRIRTNLSEVERLVCDNSKILKTTDWKPKYDLETGLKETINWFGNKGHLYKSGIYNI